MSIFSKSSTQLITPNYPVSLPPMQQHSFFTNLPPLQLKITLLTFIQCIKQSVSLSAKKKNRYAGMFTDFSFLPES